MTKCQRCNNIATCDKRINMKYLEWKIDISNCEDFEENKERLNDTACRYCTRMGDCEDFNSAGILPFMCLNKKCLCDTCKHPQCEYNYGDEHTYEEWQERSINCPEYEYDKYNWEEAYAEDKL